MDGISDPTGYNAHDYFTGHLFHSNHQPSTSYLLNSIDNMCYRYSNSTDSGQNNSTNTTYFLKSEQSVIVTFFFENLEVGSNKTEIRFVTPYQTKILNIYYHGIPGQLIHSYHSDQTTLTMGKYSVIDIYTYSTFQETIQIDLISSSSRLLPIVMHTPSANDKIPDRITDDQTCKSNQTDLGFLTAHVISPYLECLVPYSRLRKINLWGCTIVLLEEWLSSINSAYNPSLAYPTSSIRPIVITDEEYGLYTKMLDILRPIEGDIIVGRYDIAMQHIYEFRSKWLAYFPQGIPIPDFNVVFRSGVTSSPFTISNVHIQIPLSKSSFYSNFITSPITYSQVVFIYFVIVNPYDVVLEVKILDDHLPLSTFTEYDLEKFPDLDNFTLHDNEDLEQKKRREIYPFENPEKIFPYSHLPNSIAGSRDLKKIMSMPQELRVRQRIQTVPTSLSSIVSDDFLDSTNILNSESENDFFMVKNLITIPRYFANIAVSHPPFGRYGSSSIHTLAPQAKQLFGPIAFIPVSDEDNSFSVDRYYNLSLYFLNNYTGIEKVDVICPVSKILLSVSDVKLDTLESPELEPSPAPSSSELFESRPGLITLSTLHSFSLPISPDQPQSSIFHLTPFSISEAITVMANQEAFTVQIYLNNTSRVQTVIDKILVNGKYDICRGQDIPDRNVFPVFPKSSSAVLTSSSVCETLPLILSPNELHLLNLTFRVNCLYLSEHFTVSFLSDIYSSSRSVFLFHCSVYVTMTAYLTNICRMRNFSMDSQINYLFKILGLLLLGVFSFQTHKISGFLNKFASDEKKRPRSAEFRTKKILPISASQIFAHPESLDPHGYALDPSITPSVEAFPYLRKGIHLQDIFPIIDPSNSQYEAIDTLKSKRISSYYSPSPSKQLKSASSSGSTEEIVLEDIEKNIRNPIILSSSVDNSFVPPEMETTNLEDSNEYEEISSLSENHENASDLAPSSSLPVAVLPTPPETPAQKPPRPPKNKRNGSSKVLKSKVSDEVLSKQSSLDDLSEKELPKDSETLQSSVTVAETPSPSLADLEEPSDFSSDLQAGKEFLPPNPEEIQVLDHLGSDALRASVIHSVSNGAQILENTEDYQTASDQTPTVVYPPNTFDTYEPNEIWEHVEPLPEAPVPMPSLSPSRSISINGIEHMVAEILDSQTTGPIDPVILKSDSTDSTGVLQNHSYDDWQYEKSKFLDQVPTPPPGFAGALGTYENFSYYSDLSSPRQDSFQVPLDPSYLRHGESKRSPSHGAIGESTSFMTPPRRLPSTSNTNSPSHQTYPQLLSLPAPELSSHDLLGDDAEWEAMLTMPFEDMSGQVSNLSQLPGLSGQNSLSGYRSGSSNDSFHSSHYGSYGLTQPPLPQNSMTNRVNNQIQRSHPTPNYRSVAPNYSSDGRMSQNSTGVHYPQPGAEAYGYHSYASPPTHTSPNRSFQTEYQQRQYNPRRSVPQSYDAADYNGLGVHPNVMYEMDRRNVNPSGVYQGSLYSPSDRFPQQPMQGSYQSYGIGQYHSYPSSQSDVPHYGSHGMSYQSPNHEARPRESPGSGGGAPGLSPHGGYYQSGFGQPNQYPQRESNNSNRHNQQ